METAWRWRQTPQSFPASECRDAVDLIIVCCHATYDGTAEHVAEDHWILQDFQRADPNTGKPSEVETFQLHILAGTLAAKNNPRALLVFSGGKTTSSDRSEAQGYEQLYLRLDKSLQVEHYAREDYATDSFQNLLFSILRFRQVTGRYPTSVTVITHAFKQSRFLDLHAPAIKWPSHRIRVQGVNPPFTRTENNQAEAGEVHRARKLFENDPYGVGPELSSKQLDRGFSPAAVEDAYMDVEPEVYTLLRWTGGSSGRETFPFPLPWESAEGLTG